MFENKILISAYPFGYEKKTFEILKKNKIDYELYQSSHLPNSKQLVKLLKNKNGIIAGTEIISKNVLKKLPNLKIISRVGIGLDSVDLNYAKKKNIAVTYTPDAPSASVAELTIGFIFDLLRGIAISNMNVKNKKWDRYLGGDLSKTKIGIIGAGRIGKKVIGFCEKLKFEKIFFNDINLEKKKISRKNIFFKSKKYILKNSDIISIHVPFSSSTINMIDKKELKIMKKDVCIINTSRGGIVNEVALLKFLKKGLIKGVALDVFTKEPYYGELINHKNCILTPHIGSMSLESRKKMEIQSVENIVNFFMKKKIKNRVV